MGFCKALYTLGSLLKGFYRANIYLMLKDLNNSHLLFQTRVLYLQGLM